MVDETPKQEARRRIEQAARTGATELVLGGLRLTSVPPEITTLENLWYLDLRGNRLTTLPPEIPQLQNLRQLSLSYNQLTVLPPEIGMLQNLRELHLDGTHLTTLPPEIPQLQNLRQLSLSYNQLTVLSPEIGMLQNLRELHLESNQLNSLPPEIGQLQKLQTLDLSHNPLPEPYPELIERGTDAVLNYLRSLATESTVLYEAKLLLVGEGNVGKTSLVEAMAVKPAKRKEVFKANRSTTHGISLGQLKLDHPGGDAAKRITMNTWDFGGQDVYRITHQFFFSKRSLYLLVWWPREGQEAGGVKGWLDRIRLRVPDARVILVSTHADEPRPPEIDYRELEGAFPGMLAGRHAIDSKSGTGVDDLLATIAAEGAKLPQMGEKMSRHWIETRDKVLANREPQIARALRSDRQPTRAGRKRYRNTAQSVARPRPHRLLRRRRRSVRLSGHQAGVADQGDRICPRRQGYSRSERRVTTQPSPRNLVRAQGTDFRAVCPGFPSVFPTLDGEI